MTEQDLNDLEDAEFMDLGVASEQTEGTANIPGESPSGSSRLPGA